MTHRSKNLQTNFIESKQMEKKFFFTRYRSLFFILAFYIGNAQISHGQSIKRQAISSIGSVGHIGSTSISQTAGQAYDTKAAYEHTAVSPGFQQPLTYEIEDLAQAEMPAFDIKLFPNPARHTVNISTSANIPEGWILVTDLTGKTMIRQPYTDLRSQRLDCSGWQPGSYFITITDGKKAFKTSKLIISK
jgi:hypothetical protein